VREGYFSEGFLAIQRAVDLSIVNELGGISSAQKIDVQLKRFPFPPYLDDDFLISTDRKDAFLSPNAVILVSFIATMASICLDVVLEKEKKLKVSLCVCEKHFFSFYFILFQQVRTSATK